MMKTEERSWRLTALSPFETRFEFEEKDWSFLLLGQRMASWVRSAQLHSHPRLHPHQFLKKRLAIHQQSHIVSLPNSHSHLRGRVFCNFDDETTKKQSQPQPTGIQLYSEIERFSVPICPFSLNSTLIVSLPSIQFYSQIQYLFLFLLSDYWQRL